MAGAEPLTLERPHRINGFEYEIGEAIRCIRAGQMESGEIPLEEMRRMMGWMEVVRGGRWGCGIAIPKFDFWNGACGRPAIA